MVACSELRWNALHILPPSLLAWWVTFPIYPQSVCPWLRGTFRWALLHLPLFSPVSGLLCLTCQVFYIGLLICLRYPLYCSICSSVLSPVSLFQPLRSGIHDFLLQGSPALDGLPCICCDPFLPSLLLASQAGFAGLCTGYSDLLPHGVDVAFVGRCMLFSICQCLKLVLQLEDESTPYSRFPKLFFTAICCFLALSGPFLLSFSFKFAVTRWWSLSTSSPFLTDILQRSSPCPLIIRWSIWFLSLPLGEHHVSLLISRCGKSVPPTTKSYVM